MANSSFGVAIPKIHFGYSGNSARTCFRQKMSAGSGLGGTPFVGMPSKTRLAAVSHVCTLVRLSAERHCQGERLEGHQKAGVAQLAEQLICNQQVAGSSPIAGSVKT